MSAIGPLLPGAVNTRPPTVTVYIAIADGRCAMANLSKSRVWDKVPEKSTLMFRDTIIPLKTA